MTDKYTIVYNQLHSCLEAVNIICFSLIWVCVCVCHGWGSADAAFFKCQTMCYNLAMAYLMHSLWVLP